MSGGWVAVGYGENGPDVTWTYDRRTARRFVRRHGGRFRVVSRNEYGRVMYEWRGGVWAMNVPV